MANWPKQRQVLGRRTPRLEGPLKVTGRAKYASDINTPGLLHAFLMRSPYGRARVKSVSVDAARAMPGVKRVNVSMGPGGFAQYHGQGIAEILAETAEQARDAARALHIEWDVQHAVTTPQQSLAPDAPKVQDRGNFRTNEEHRGDVDGALAGAATVHEGTYGCDVIMHCCLESKGGTAQWDADGKLTVWASTQALYATREALLSSHHLPADKLEVICEHMGGGFGSKLGMDGEVNTASWLAKASGAPAKAFNDRSAELTDGGCRQYAQARVKVGCDAQGKLTAFDAEQLTSGGLWSEGGFGLPSNYGFGATRVKRTSAFINAGNERAFRAPGAPPAAFITESAIEGLAFAHGNMDPLEFRLHNVDGGHGGQLKMVADRLGWGRRQPTGSQKGRLRHGFGVAITGWGGGPNASQARVEIHADGTVDVFCATQDIGSGTRTAMAVVAAETFGLEPTQISVHIGHSQYPPGGGSGGSTTIGAVSSATRTAGEQARDQLLSRVAPVLGANPSDIDLAGGKLSAGGKSISWADACRRLGPDVISETAGTNRALTGGGVAGAQGAEIEVDTETGIVRVVKVVAVQDCGLVVNRLTAESQVYGGVVMGIGQALYEERVLDPHTGHMLNDNMEWYRLPTIGDVGEIEVVLEDHPERGVIGIGEPPVIPTMPAIGNAVFNALGVQVSRTPMTPARVLAALAGGTS
jgi:xanthine dehydrogenase YagR molybdenum-binding subunit